MVINKDAYTLYLGSMLDVLDELPENSIDAVVTDPPYEINFMSKGWDNTGIVFKKETWQKVLKVLKPGGHLLAFNHSRTFHRMAVAIEDAGFQIRDTILWLYGSGFPKSHNISIAIDKKFGAERKVVGMKNPHLDGGIRKQTSPAQFGMDGSDRKGKKELNNGMIEITAPSTDETKQWDGWGTALKPSYEPIIMARKPLDGTVADNVLKHGVGGINIDECRVGNDEISTHNAPKGTFAGGESGRGSDTESYTSHTGRFPANTIHDGSDEVVKGFPNVGGGNYKEANARHRKGFMIGDVNGTSNAPDNYGDSGSASRFFYTAKASKKDRDEGLDGFQLKEVRGGGGRANNGYDDQDEEQQRLKKAATAYGAVKSIKRNIHPTVKPTDLMQYLVRLVTPKGGTVLDPFMGSGSTGKAAMIENNERNANYHFIGIDLQKEYIDIAHARIEYGVNYQENKAIEQEEQIVGKNQLGLELW